MIKELELLSKLEFYELEGKEIGKHMNDMIEFLDKIKEVDTENIEPLTHLQLGGFVFREDIVTNSDDREAILYNAADKKDGKIRVPKTID